MQNLRSLRNILRDIIERMNHQVLGNCDILERMEIVVSESTVVTELQQDATAEQPKPLPYGAFKRDRIDVLVRGPLKLALGRLNGLQKVIADIEKQITVSTGKV